VGENKFLSLCARYYYDAIHPYETKIAKINEDIIIIIIIIIASFSLVVPKNKKA
jgi:hypothetical protein